MVFKSAEATDGIESVPPVPPTREPRVPEYEKAAEVESDDVATFARVLAPEKYVRFPTVAGVEVVRPFQVKAPVPELYAIGKVPEKRPRAVEEKSEMVEASWVPVWLVRSR